MGNPRDAALGNLDRYVGNLINSRAGMLDLSGLPTTQGLNELTNQYFNLGSRNIGRNISQAGQLGAARGYSLGLSNPFAFSQVAENQARGALGDLEAQRAAAMLQNPLTAQQLRFQANQANNQYLAQLLGLRGQLAGGMSEGFGNEILGGLIGGLGKVGGALIGGPAGMASGMAANTVSPYSGIGYRLTNPATGLPIGYLGR